VAAFEAKVIHVPFEVKGKDGPELKFSKTGVRIELKGEWWFYKYTTKIKGSDGTARSKAAHAKWLKEQPTDVEQRKDGDKADRTGVEFDCSTWTRHIPGLPLFWKSGSPMLENGQPVLSPETKQGPYVGDAELREAHGHTKRPWNLVEVLLMARTDAEIKDAEKRAAA